MADLDLELREGGGVFSYSAGFSFFCDFFSLLPKIWGGGGWEGNPLGPLP